MQDYQLYGPTLLRIASGITLGITLGVVFLAHSGSGWLFSNEGGGFEYLLFLAAASLAQALLGSLALSAADFSQQPQASRV